METRIISPIKELLEMDKTRDHFLSPDERKLYRLGLTFLGLFAGEGFFDVGKLPNNRFETDGIFYTICYFDSEQLWSYGNTRMLMVAWEISNRSSHCPFNIEVVVDDDENYKLVLNDNIGINGRSMKWTIIQRNPDGFTTEIPDFPSLKFSDLIRYTEKKSKEVIYMPNTQYLSDKLRELRVNISERENIAPYSVFDDEELQDLLQNKPKTTSDLVKIKGFPKDGARVTKWGQEILDVINQRGANLDSNSFGNR